LSRNGDATVAQKKTGATAVAEQFLAHVYPVQLDPEEDGGYVVTLPDIGYGATQGDTLEEALRQAEDMLEEAILGMIAHKEDVPAPSPAEGRPVVGLPALTAAKLEVYRAMRQAGLDEAQLAQRLGWPAKKVTDVFDGYHVVRLEQLEAALAALGRRFVVTSEPA
jgi:antitoxin HicB